MKNNDTLYKQKDWEFIKAQLAGNPNLRLDYDEKQNGIYRVFVVRGNTQFFVNLFPPGFGTVVGASDTNDADYQDFVDNYKAVPDVTPPATVPHAIDPDTGNAVPVWSQRVTGDGKTRVLSSHKPVIPGKEAYNFFSSFGDDPETGELAEGEGFLLSCTSGTATTSVAMRFSNTGWPTEVVYVFGGGVAWENAGWGDFVSLEIRAEETPVVPKAVAEGLGLPVDYNLDDTRIVYAGPGSGTHALGGYPKWVPNYKNVGHWNLDTRLLQAIPASGSGYFDWFIEDVEVGEYVKKLLVYGTNYDYMLIDGTESAPLPFGTYFVATAHNISNTNWKAWGMVKMYRERLK